MNYTNLTLLDILKTESITSTHERAFIADDIFDILAEAYSDVKGGLLFSSVDDLILKTAMWKVIYFQSNIVGVVIYKAKKGLKMVALAISSQVNKKLRNNIKIMLHEIFKMTFGKTWMEVSEGAEKFLMKIGGIKFMLPNTLANSLTGKEILSLDEDGYHYYREINGIVKRKIILGTVKNEKV